MTKRSRRPTGRPDDGAAVEVSTSPIVSATTRSRSPSGTARAGRRARPVRRYETRTFFDRYRTPLLIAFALAGLVLIGVFVFVPRSVYACDALLTPGPSDPVPTPTPVRPSPSATATSASSPTAGAGATASPTGGASPSGSASPTSSSSPATSPGATGTASPSAGVSPSASATAAASASPSASPTAAPAATQRLGFQVTDLGAQHTSSLSYDFCPPASGPHQNIRGVGPLPRGFYGPAGETSPGGWVHNLEHGFVVFAYSCRDACPSAETLASIRQTWESIAQTEQAQACGLPNKVLVVRFDQMNTKYAAIAWDRVLLMDTWDASAATTFAQQWQSSPQAPEQNLCDR